MADIQQPQKPRTIADILANSATSNVESASASAPSPIGGTDTLRNLLAARSGKAVTGPETREENLGETAAAGAARAGVREQELGAKQEIQNQAQAATQKLGSIEQQAQESSRADALKAKSIAQASAIHTNQLLDSAREQRLDLSVRKNAAMAEQIGFTLRLGSEKYVADLQKQGSLQRLNDEASFRQAAAQSEYDSNMANLIQKEAWVKMMQEDEATFQTDMSKQAFDLEMYMKQMAQKSKQFVSGMEALSSATTGVIGAAASPRGPEEKEPGVSNSGLEETGPVGDIGGGMLS